MSEAVSQDYYRARAMHSRDLAQRATDASIAAIHADLAARYDVLAGQADDSVAVAPAGVQAT